MVNSSRRCVWHLVFSFRRPLFVASHLEKHQKRSSPKPSQKKKEKKGSKPTADGGVVNDEGGGLDALCSLFNDSTNFERKGDPLEMPKRDSRPSHVVKLSRKGKKEIDTSSHGTLIDQHPSHIRKKMEKSSSISSLSKLSVVSNKENVDGLDFLRFQYDNSSYSEQKSERNGQSRGEPEADLSSPATVIKKDPRIRKETEKSSPISSLSKLSVVSNKENVDELDFLRFQYDNSSYSEQKVERSGQSRGEPEADLSSPNIIKKHPYIRKETEKFSSISSASKKPSEQRPYPLSKNYIGSLSRMIDATSKDRSPESCGAKKEYSKQDNASIQQFDNLCSLRDLMPVQSTRNSQNKNVEEGTHAESVDLFNHIHNLECQVKSLLQQLDVQNSEIEYLGKKLKGSGEDVNSPEPLQQKLTDEGKEAKEVDLTEEKPLYPDVESIVLGREVSVFDGPSIFDGSPSSQVFDFPKESSESFQEPAISNEAQDYERTLQSMGFDVQMSTNRELWEYPIDNQADIEENRHSFRDHVFLESHLNDFPQVESVQIYMELVITGLQQNPFLSYDKKIDRILWYKRYFAKIPEESL